MSDWDDAVDILLNAISKSYTRKSAGVKKWADDLIYERVWHGGNKREKVRVTKKGGARAPRKQKRTKSSSSTPTPMKVVWTKDQREEATRKKADEADAAALNGVRKSRRARVPTEKVLNRE
jgi:hypothetical protein